MRVVEEAELLVSLGLFYARGSLNHNLMSVQRLLRANVGQPIYNSIINYNRFEFIKKMIGFDNAAINGILTNLQHLERSLKCSITSVLKKLHTWWLSYYRWNTISNSQTSHIQNIQQWETCKVWLEFQKLRYLLKYLRLLYNSVLW